MNAAEPISFRSSGQPGYSDTIRNDARHVRARKLEREVQVRFTTDDCLIHTSEGEVHARAGDAILTGTAGEHWRVSRAHFAAKYRPIPPLGEWQDGTYRSVGVPVLALKMKRAFRVDLADGVSHLSGHPGDWLVDYGDGSLGIVSATIFAMTYEILK